jgi:hypothetical protein
MKISHSQPDEITIQIPPVHLYVMSIIMLIFGAIGAFVFASSYFFIDNNIEPLLGSIFSVIFAFSGILMYLFVPVISIIINNNSQTLTLKSVSKIKKSLQVYPLSEIKEAYLEKAFSRPTYKILLKKIDGNDIEVTPYYSCLKVHKEEIADAINHYLIRYRNSLGQQDGT